MPETKYISKVYNVLSYSVVNIYGARHVISRVDFSVCVQCQIRLLSVVPWFRVFPVCCSSISWMILGYFQLSVFLLVSILFLNSTCAVFLLYGPCVVVYFRLSSCSYHSVKKDEEGRTCSMRGSNEMCIANLVVNPRKETTSDILTQMRHTVSTILGQ